MRHACKKDPVELNLHYCFLTFNDLFIVDGHLYDSFLSFVRNCKFLQGTLKFLINKFILLQFFISQLYLFEFFNFLSFKFSKFFIKQNKISIFSLNRSWLWKNLKRLMKNFQWLILVFPTDKLIHLIFVINSTCECKSNEGYHKGNLVNEGYFVSKLYACSNNKECTPY